MRTLVPLVDALVLCLLRDDTGINFLSPEPFQRAELEPMRDKLRVCLKGPSLCAKALLCSQLDLDCGPVPQVCPAS